MSKEVIKPAKMSTGSVSKGSGSSASKPPANKRTFSEVSSNSSMEEISIISHNLDGLTDDVQKMRDELKQVLKKKEMTELIQNTISATINDLNKNIETTISIKIEEMTKVMQDKITSLENENSELRREIRNLKESSKDQEKRSKEALALANQNEQYSRKNNVKIMNIPEKETDLPRAVSEILQKEGIALEESRVMAIHRIPGKKDQPRPVLIKFLGNNDKTKVMTHRKEMKALGHRLVDDVTKLNVGLLQRLSNESQIESSWYFNGSIYGKTKKGMRIRFDLFDDIKEVIRKAESNSR